MLVKEEFTERDKNLVFTSQVGETTVIQIRAVIHFAASRSENNVKVPTSVAVR